MTPSLQISSISIETSLPFAFKSVGSYLLGQASTISQRALSLPVSSSTTMAIVDGIDGHVEAADLAEAGLLDAVNFQPKAKISQRIVSRHDSEPPIC